MMDWIEPSWPAPPGVRAAFTTRRGGVSKGPFASLNLASHVGDEPRRVQSNRRGLRADLGLPDEPFWLDQVHGNRVVCADAGNEAAPAADGAWSSQVGTVCAVLVADCLPVLLADTKGRLVAAVHAGWRGLATGILENAVDALRRARLKNVELQAWIGPAISQTHFEVGGEVLAAFADHVSFQAHHFRAQGNRWHADLPGIARARLGAAGVHNVYGGDACSYASPYCFYSYRRDGQCGRMAGLIWRTRQVPEITSG